MENALAEGVLCVFIGKNEGGKVRDCVFYLCVYGGVSDREHKWYL